MKNLLMLLAVLFVFSHGRAQVYSTSSGTIKFFSKTTAENIDATNNQVKAALDAKTGNLEFAVSINSFLFKKALMQKHFQENYLESEKFPKSTFKGSITDNAAVKYVTDGTYPVSVKGKLTMHGVTKDVVIPGKVTVSGSKAVLSTDFNVLLEDYNIKIPANNASQIAKSIKVSVDCSLQKKK
ncbi:MAG: YceI family protein [Sphingomonadales bacterium]|nr:YceI family protein [Sphingomonadales bacterium]